MNRLSFAKILIIATIILIAAFQCYWIMQLYNQERETLRRETDVIFRDVVYKLQLQRLQQDTAFAKHGDRENLFAFDVINAIKQNASDSQVLDKLKIKESGQKRLMISLQSRTPNDSNIPNLMRDSFRLPATVPGSPMLFRFTTDGKNIHDSLPLGVIDSAYAAELRKNNITIGFSLQHKVGAPGASLPKADRQVLTTNFIAIGLNKSFAYQASFNEPAKYLLARIKSPIIISLLLIAFTIISFVFLYRNLVVQKHLASVKNEFISNITHELKTPIATVNVAIEALRNFNAIQDPVKTKEYLDISASELQRLSLLVDKVLRLAMFENGEVELKKEKFDLKLLVAEVLSIMQLQVEKQHARITLHTDGNDFVIEADKLHITSVLYNLLDNALKYKRTNPEIEIFLAACRMHIELKVKDNGIGIPQEYQRRIFEKLFRVPTQDVHNTKGYGLGLSYVSHIIKRHMGFIDVQSEPGIGSVFTALIPYREMDLIRIDDKRTIRKIKFGLPRKKTL